jgi:DNA-binding transcriptional LysR family regulator
MIDRETLFHLPTFVTVAETASFTGASGKLGMTPSAVSQAIRALEDRIGHPLFVRTTRHVSLTDAGRLLLKHAQQQLRELEVSLDIARAAASEPAGLLRLNIPRIAMPMIMEPMLPILRERYPKLRIEIALNDATVDIVEQGFDAGIRLGGMAEQDMIAVPITPVLNAILTAAPSYVARKGMPLSLGELSKHDTIGFRFGRTGRIYRWELQDEGKDIEIETESAIIVNDSLFNLSLCVSGYGIAHMFDRLAAPYQAEGSLVQILPQHTMPESPFVVYFPRYANEQPKLRAFINVAREVMRVAVDQRSRKT